MNNILVIICIICLNCLNCLSVQKNKIDSSNRKIIIVTNMTIKLPLITSYYSYKYDIV